MVEAAIQFLNQLVGMSDEQVAPYFLGAGSTREAYRFRQEYIIKIPRFVIRFRGRADLTNEQIIRIIRKGVQQTKTEIKTYQTCDDRHRYLLNPVICHGLFLNMPFVVMPYLKIASKEVDFSVSNLSDFVTTLDLCVPRGFYRDIVNLSNAHALYCDDMLDNTDNFGIDGSNRIFITDYGFEEDSRKII